MATKKRSERKRKADPDTEPGDEVGGGEKHRPVNEKTHGKGKDKYIGAHVSIAGISPPTANFKQMPVI